MTNWKRYLGLLIAAFFATSLMRSDAEAGVRFYDPETAPVTPIKGVSDISNAPFRSFVIDALAQLKAAGGGQGQLDVTFVRIPVVAQGDRPFAMPDAPAVGTGSRCRVESPWARLAFGAGGGSVLSGVVVWSERQLLADLHPAPQTLPIVPQEPYRPSVFDRMARTYAEEVVSRRATSLPKDLPGDLAVLFQRAPQSTLLPFAQNARAAMRTIAAEKVQVESGILKEILAACADGTAGEFLFERVTDIPNLN